ncbi:hypothetical protein N7461_002727 [Penicillium sp. DV-2018c]|nr:hypothetical protein N7461_002727 [Penicillium sp. DV-2018c]
MPLPKWESAEEEMEYRNNFFGMIGGGQPNQVMDAMTDPRSMELVGSMAPAEFTKYFLLLSKEHFVEPYRRLHHTLHHWGVLMQGLRTLEAVFDDFTRNLLTIIQYRVAGGNPPQLDEYTHLLDCARAMGNGPLADELWNAMDANEIRPDTTCYNHYMAAKVWDHCFVGKESYNLRILPHTYWKRRKEIPSPGWRGYGTAQNSIRKVILDRFYEMNEDGLDGDEQTYINIFIAACRVGDNIAAQNVLKTVWNVDVEHLMEESDNSLLPPVTEFEPGDPLYPTEKLLFAVAHGFGNNSDIHAAIRTVDFIAFAYGLKIPTDVWYELFERTYALSKGYSRRQAEEGRMGGVPREMVHGMFEKITTEHNVPVTLQMYRFTTQAHIRDGNLEMCKRDMRKAYDILSETRAKRKEARDTVMHYLQPALDTMRPPADEKSPSRKVVRRPRTECQPPDMSLLQCSRLAEAIHRYDLLRLEVFQQIYLLQRIAFAVVRKRGWHWRDTDIRTWELQERPKIQEEWKDFIPGNFIYEYNNGETGTVEFWGTTRPNSRYLSRFGRIPARRIPGHPELFHPVEDKILDDKAFWQLLLKEYPGLDVTISPLNRLYSFQTEHSDELKEKLRKFQTWIEYPEEHPLSRENNPDGGLYGRLIALDLEIAPERSIFWRDGDPWLSA